MTREDLALMLKVEDVKHALEMEYLKLRCISYQIYMYLAKGLHKAQQELDEDEFLEVLTIPLDEAVKMVMNNEIEDAKTQLALLKASVLLG